MPLLISRKEKQEIRETLLQEIESPTPFNWSFDQKLPAFDSDIQDGLTCYKKALLDDGFFDVSEREELRQYQRFIPTDLVCDGIWTDWAMGNTTGYADPTKGWSSFNAYQRQSMAHTIGIQAKTNIGGAIKLLDQILNTPDPYQQYIVVRMQAALELVKLLDQQGAMDILDRLQNNNKLNPSADTTVLARFVNHLLTLPTQGPYSIQDATHASMPLVLKTFLVQEDPPSLKKIKIYFREDGTYSIEPKNADGSDLDPPVSWDSIDKVPSAKIRQTLLTNKSLDSTKGASIASMFVDLHTCWAAYDATTVSPPIQPSPTDYLTTIDILMDRNGLVRINTKSKNGAGKPVGGEMSTNNLISEHIEALASNQCLWNSGLHARANQPAANPVLQPASPQTLSTTLGSNDPGLKDQLLPASSWGLGMAGVVSLLVAIEKNSTMATTENEAEIDPAWRARTGFSIAAGTFLTSAAVLGGTWVVHKIKDKKRANSEKTANTEP